MGVALAQRFPTAARTWEEADEALGESLRGLAAEGPAEALTRTENAQPAILANSIAAWRVLREETGLVAPQAFAGHSLGEWSALVAAGALDLADAVRLVRARGRFMQEATPPGEGGMAAVMGLDAAALAAACGEIAEAGEVLAPANFNGGGQVVVAGHATAIERALVGLKERGARRVVRLDVSAPFHCELMRPAADRLKSLLDDTPFRAPSAPVWTNVEASPNDDPARMADLLFRQVVSPVRWEDTIHGLVGSGAGVTSAVELGHGRVLAGLARRLAPELKVLPCGGPEDIDNLN